MASSSNGILMAPNSDAENPAGPGRTTPSVKSVSKKLEGVEVAKPEAPSYESMTNSNAEMETKTSKPTCPDRATVGDETDEEDTESFVVPVLRVVDGKLTRVLMPGRVIDHGMHCYRGVYVPNGGGENKEETTSLQAGGK